MKRIYNILFLSLVLVMSSCKVEPKLSSLSYELEASCEVEGSTLFNFIGGNTLIVDSFTEYEFTNDKENKIDYCLSKYPDREMNLYDALQADEPILSSAKRISDWIDSSFSAYCDETEYYDISIGGYVYDPRVNCVFYVYKWLCSKPTSCGIVFDEDEE